MNGEKKELEPLIKDGHKKNLYTSTIFPSPSNPFPCAQKFASGFHTPPKSEEEEGKRSAMKMKGWCKNLLAKKVIINFF